MRQAVCAQRVSVLALAATIAAACAGIKEQPGNPDAAGTPGGGGVTGTTTGVSGNTGSGGGVVITGVAGTLGVSGSTGTGGSGACVPNVTCNPPGGQYCGKIGNGCPGGSMECGNNCPSGWTCEGNLCVGGTSCAALTCGSYCGSIGDNCGHTLMCTTCPSGQMCQGGICVNPGCVPLTCNAPGGNRYCGMIGDGCGGTLDCMTCPGGGACGSGGVLNVCRNPNCTPITCTPMGGQYCGMIGDNCGGILNCGNCTDGMACPTTGAEAHICPGSMGTGTVPPTCTGTTKTTISGTVYDPAGINPLYNVIVYVPNSSTLPAITEGASCDKCGAQVNAPLASALTDTQGRFTMTFEPVPSTTNVPVVFQIGKWRRQIMLSSIQTCRDNPITDKNLTRLPRNKGEGHMPRMALTTGGSDALECFLRKIGIADAEFTTDSGAGRVHMYVGGEPGAGGGGQGADKFTAALGGASFPAATTLWGNAMKMLGYDIVIMSCEGGQYADTKLPFIANVKRYADAGGRLFNDHLHYYWLRSGPQPWPMTATYIGNGAAPTSPVMGAINTTFPKGGALADWLVTVGASPARGQIQLYGAQHSVDGVRAPTQAWITIGAATEYLTFNTPVEAAESAQCGRVVETDLHVKDVPSNQNGKDDSDPKNPFPSACLSTTLSAQEKALEFLFFDLTSCVEPPTNMPRPPIVPPPGTPTGPPPSVMRPPAVPPPPPPPPPPIID